MRAPQSGCDDDRKSSRRRQLASTASRCASVVTLVHPNLFVQDVTGGVAVQMQKHSQPSNREMKSRLGHDRPAKTRSDAGPPSRCNRAPALGSLAHLTACHQCTAGYDSRRSRDACRNAGRGCAEREEAGKLVIDLERGTQAFRAIVDNLPEACMYRCSRHIAWCACAASPSLTNVTQKVNPFCSAAALNRRYRPIAELLWSARHLLQETIVALLV